MAYPHPFLTFAKAGATIVGGLFALSLVSSTTVKVIQLVTESKRVFSSSIKTSLINLVYYLSDLDNFIIYWIFLVIENGRLFDYDFYV